MMFLTAFLIKAGRFDILTNYLSNASITTSLRYYVPYYVRIFGQGIGIQMMLLATPIRNIIIILFILAFI